MPEKSISIRTPDHGYPNQPGAGKAYLTDVPSPYGSSVTVTVGDRYIEVGVGSSDQLQAVYYLFERHGLEGLRVHGNTEMKIYGAALDDLRLDGASDAPTRGDVIRKLEQIRDKQNALHDRHQSEKDTLQRAGFNP